MKTKNACPFCGYNSTQVLSPHNNNSNLKGYQVECLNCGARGPCGMVSQKAAIGVWDKGDLHYERPLINSK